MKSLVRLILSLRGIAGRLLADSLIRLLGNQGMARSMGSAGRARGEAKFSWERIIDSLNTCYFGSADGATAVRVQN